MGRENGTLFVTSNSIERSQNKRLMRPGFQNRLYITNNFPLDPVRHARQVNTFHIQQVGRYLPMIDILLKCKRKSLESNAHLERSSRHLNLLYFPTPRVPALPCLDLHSRIPTKYFELRRELELWQIQHACNFASR